MEKTDEEELLEGLRKARGIFKAERHRTGYNPERSLETLIEAMKQLCGQDGKVP
jgi:hypothetical protein